MGYIDLPVSGGGITIYPNFAAFPPSAQDGAQGVAADTNSIYIYNASLPGWVAVATPPVGVFISSLTNDVTATGPGAAAATVAFVGGETAADVAQSVQDTQAATASSTVSTLVKRDSNGETALDGLSLDGSTSGAIKLQAAATTTSYTVKMPNAQGAASTYLQNDGSGNLSWVTISSGANTSLSNLVAPTAVNVALLGTLGSNSAPAYSFSGDTDTGMYSSGANTINLATNGSERLSVDSSGNVKVPNYILSPQLYPGGTKTASFNIDWANGPVQEFTLNVSGGTVSLSSSTWSNPVTGGAYVLKIIQGATPTNITAWPASVLWGAAGIPTLSGATGDIDIINFIYDGTNYYGTYALGF